MDLRINRNLDTLDAVPECARKWRKEIRDADVDDILESLNTTRKAARALNARMGELGGQTERGQQIKAWRKVVRARLLVLRSAAKTHLTDANGKPLGLQVPPFKAVAGPLIKASNTFQAALGPRLQELIAAKGARPDALDKLADAADQLFKWRLMAPDSRKERTRVRAELQKQVSKGRGQIELLLRSLAEVFEWHPNIKTAFLAAAKVKNKPGPAPSRAKFKREATYRKRPKRRIARPKRIETVFTPEEIAAAVAKEEQRVRSTEARDRLAYERALARREQQRPTRFVSAASAGKMAVPRGGHHLKPAEALGR